jgi:hypothetical protein
LSTWLASLTRVFVEPPAVAEPPAYAAGSRSRARVVVAVVGLRRGSGTTTVARALAAELALRDVGRAALVTATALAGGGIPLGTPAAARLARAASRAGAGPSRAVGRLAIFESHVDYPTVLPDLGPLVADVTDCRTGVAAALGEVTVLVASPDCQPALAAVVSESAAGSPCVTVLNRHHEDETAWEGRCDVHVPESRLGAQLALAGREAPSAFGRAIATLADRVLDMLPDKGEPIP